MAATAVGRATSSTTVTCLIDTNILVYAFDPRDRTKQEIARKVKLPPLVATGQDA